MNFDIICPNCGAPSSPTVGICPFCKAVLTSKDEKKSPSITKIKELYNEGKIDQALSLAKMAETSKPDLIKKASFVLLYVQILIEVDAPSSKINALLTQGLLENPNDPLLSEYLEISQARSHLSHEKNDLGEQTLTNIIRRSPQNIHALFLLGSHLFWVEKDVQRALRYLEQCVRYRPNFVRANACLGAIYKHLNLDANAAKLFRKCASLSANPGMKQYFKSLSV